MCFSAEAALARVLEHIIMKWSSNYFIFLPMTLQMPHLQLEAGWFSAQWLFFHSKSVEQWLLMTAVQWSQEHPTLETTMARAQEQTELPSSSSGPVWLKCPPGPGFQGSPSITPAGGNGDMGTGHPPLTSPATQHVSSSRRA